MTWELPELLPPKNELTRTEFLELAYEIFWRDFVFEPDIIVAGLPVRLKHGLWAGKELTFWHLASNAPDFMNKGVSRERCRYLPWLKVMLQNYENCICWENERRSEKNLCIVDKEWRLIIVLRRRKNYFLLWTAYPLSKSRRVKLQHEEERSRTKMKAENVNRG